DIDIRRYLPGRRLYAFDARTGDILWKQNINWETPNGQKDPRDLAAGPPAAAKGRVFLPVYSASGTIDLSLLAFDLHTGASLWRTFLVSGSLESNLFGNVLTELASAPPWTDGNSVVLCTNLGAICSLDSTYGFVRWTRLYEKSAIRTYQTGDLSRREPGFVNQAPTCDGDKFFCAPSDSRWALALRVQDGEQLHQWPSRPQGSGGPAFDWLSGLLGNAVLLSGTHLQLQPLEQGKPPILTSPLLHNRYSSAATRRPAILARGEILMPTPEGIQSLDPRTGASLRPPLPWPQGMNDFGALQAIPGGVLVFRQGGVIALGSTAGLLATLPSEPDLALLRSALPLLESLDKGMDPSQAAEIARRCEALAQNCTDPHVAQRLTLVAVRAWNSAHKFERGLPHLSPLLNSEFPDLAETSALWVLRPESFSFIPQKITMEALDVFTNNRNSAPGPEVALPDSTKRVLLIAQIRIAEKHPDKDALRSHLLHAVLWNAEQQTGPLAEESIQDWASQKLIALVQDPRQARGLEADAQRYLEEASPSAAVLRAFGTTDIIQSWLEERSHDESLARADEIALLALLRDHSKGPLERL
ncbi:MAG: PQQ-binding-like beta-propeller repeat protein, partial [Planctomycetes bacterium]|nr:PQQ-binding-like beta-propeller repeat protein [Planctomycetota bacterium]